MTAPKLAISRPATLTGRVGQGGDNRIHDVALVHAEAQQRLGGRPVVFAGHVVAAQVGPPARGAL